MVGKRNRLHAHLLGVYLADPRETPPPPPLIPRPRVYGITVASRWICIYNGFRSGLLPDMWHNQRRHRASLCFSHQAQSHHGAWRDDSSTKCKWHRVHPGFFIPEQPTAFSKEIWLTNNCPGYFMFVKEMASNDNKPRVHTPPRHSALWTYFLKLKKKGGGKRNGFIFLGQLLTCLNWAQAVWKLGISFNPLVIHLSGTLPWGLLTVPSQGQQDYPPISHEAIPSNSRSASCRHRCHTLGKNVSPTQTS